MRLWFSRRVLKNPVYLAYTIFRVPPKKQNIANYVANLALTKQTLFFRLFVFCSFAPSPHEYTVSRGVPNPKKSEF